MFEFFNHNRILVATRSRHISGLQAPESSEQVNRRLCNRPVRDHRAVGSLDLVQFFQLDLNSTDAIAGPRNRRQFRQTLATLQHDGQKTDRRSLADQRADRPITGGRLQTGKAERSNAQKNGPILHLADQVDYFRFM